MASCPLVRLRFVVSRPNSSRFGTSIFWEKSPSAIRASARSILRTGRITDQDSAAPETERDQQAHAREDPDRDQQEAVQRGERVRRHADPSLGRVDQLVQLVLELVGDRVLGGDVEVERAVELAGVVEGEHVVAGVGVAIVDLTHLVDRSVDARPAHRGQGVQVGQEVLLRGCDLVVVGVVLGDECHRPEVALRGDGVDRLPRDVGLLLQADELLGLLVHLPDDEDARDPHPDQEHGDHQEAGQELRVDGGADPGHEVGRGPYERREPFRIAPSTVRRRRVDDTLARPSYRPRAGDVRPSLRLPRRHRADDLRKRRF